MNINIKPIDGFVVFNNYGDGERVCYEDDVRELEAKYKEALEMLKSNQIALECLKAFTKKYTRIFYNTEDAFMNVDNIDVIEKATGKEWKELIK